MKKGKRGTIKDKSNKNKIQTRLQLANRNKTYQRCGKSDSSNVIKEKKLTSIYPRVGKKIQNPKRWYY